MPCVRRVSACPAPPFPTRLRVLDHLLACHIRMPNSPSVGVLDALNNTIQNVAEGA